MTVSELSGKIQTVLGLIVPEDLGITLTHEHFFIDETIGGVYFVEPKEASERELAHQPVTLENLYWIRYHWKDNLDNQMLLDEQMAFKEAMHFKLEGGRSIIDLTTVDLGRDPKALARISRATGLNIIMGSGYYVEGFYSKETMDAKTDKDVAEEIVQDLTVGVNDTGIRSGIIGELGCSWPLRDNERKVLRAGAYAQKRTSAAINIHPSRNDKAPIEIIEVLDNAGADLSRVVMSHMDRTRFVLDTRLKLLESGCYIEYDLFGEEGYYPARTALADGHLPDQPNDVERIKEIKELIGMGYLNQILLSHDIAKKMSLVSYGGHGYAHLLRNVIPVMKIYGITDEQIYTMIVENPRRLLTFS